MKKLISVIIVSLSMLGSMALAEEALTAQDLSQGVVIQTLHHSCTPQPKDAEPLRYCNPTNSDGNSEPRCPISYKPAPKYCWGGSGWTRCGFTCEFDSFSGGL